MSESPTLEPGLHVIDVPQRESNYEGDGNRGGLRSRARMINGSSCLLHSCLPSSEAVGPYLLLLLCVVAAGIVEGPQVRLEATGVQSSSDAWWRRVVDDYSGYQHMGRHTATT